MKSVVMLWITCLQEAGSLHCVRTHRDEAYALSRIEDEGLSFITITLPAFEKDLLQALSQGRIDSNHFCGFRRRGGLPAFMSGFLRRIFDSSGVLRSDADSSLIRSIRQVLLLCSKIELRTTQARNRKALKAYVETDEQIPDVSKLTREFRIASHRLLGDFLRDVESMVYSGSWTPRHSGGALATRESFNSRNSNLTWTERLQEVIPYWDDLVFNPRHMMESIEDISVLSRDSEPPVRVALVPKTMKGPRIIAMEPSWMQFVQQGVFHAMTDVISTEKYRPLARIFSWMDQDPNRDLARRGSLDGSFATLDLSEASDRVPLELVEALLASTPFLKKVVLACRSENAVLPDGTLVPLKKFASMGSALCFPIETMVFFIIISLAYADLSGIAPGNLRVSGLPETRVYGDDLIVPQAAAQTLVSRLESYGLKVNTRKSFTTGLFRESCGADWFQGDDVSVFKLKAPLPSSRRQSSLLEKGMSFHNRAFSHGWFKTADYVRRCLLEAYGHIPSSLPREDDATLWSTSDELTRRRTSKKYHRPEIRGMVFRYTKPEDPLDGYGALQKCLRLPSEIPRDKAHLKRDGRSRCAGVHIAWVLEG